MCRASLEGRRPQARYCSSTCRAEASRRRRLFAGEAVDGFVSLADRLVRSGAFAGLQNRTDRPQRIGDDPTMRV